MDSTPFPGPTKPGIGFGRVAFDADGNLWMAGDFGVAIHRRGEKKPAVLSKLGTRGLAVAAGAAFVAPALEPLMRITAAGDITALAPVHEPREVAASPDGRRVACSHGYPGSAVVLDDAGKVVCSIEHAALRGGREQLAFTADGRAILLFDGEALYLASPDTGEAVARPLGARIEGARRIQSFGDDFFVAHAGDGAIVRAAATVLEPSGARRFTCEGEADAAIASDAHGVFLVVRGASVEIYDRAGARSGSVARAKATFAVTDLALSHDGWLAIVAGSRSGAPAKSVELLKVV